jgi:hypothetical protein
MYLDQFRITEFYEGLIENSFLIESNPPTPPFPKGGQRGDSFFAKIYCSNRWYPEGKSRFAIFVRYGKISFSDYIHANEHIGIADHVTFGDSDVRKSAPVGKADIYKKNLSV